MIKKTTYYIQLTLILSLFWIILFERFTLKVVLAAPFVALLSIWVTETALLEDSLYEMYPFRLHRMLLYGLFLIIEIYKSGISMIPYIIFGKANPTFVEITTELESNLELAVLSNSITLTPGTITTDISGQRLVVLWLNPLTTQPTMAGIHIKGKLEKHIKEGL